MSDEIDNGNGNGKPYEAMTPEERQRLMDFILNQQAQFFTDITGLLQVNAKHERRLERAENILRSGVVLGRRVRSRVGRVEQRVDAAEVDLGAVRELLFDAARVAGENSRAVAANAEAIGELRQTVNTLAESVTKLVERNGDGA